VKMFDAGKTRMIGLPYGDKNYDDMLSRFHTIPACHGRRDRQTESVLTRDKKRGHFLFTSSSMTSSNGP